MHLSLSGAACILLNDFADGKIQIATVMVTRDQNNFTVKEQALIDESIVLFYKNPLKANIKVVIPLMRLLI
jgi:hypothetical protein